MTCKFKEQNTKYELEMIVLSIYSFLNLAFHTCFPVHIQGSLLFLYWPMFSLCFFFASFVCSRGVRNQEQEIPQNKASFFSKYYLINWFVILRVAYISSIMSMHPTDCTRITGCWNLHNQRKIMIIWLCPNGWNVECFFIRFSYLSSYEIFICFIHTWLPRKICQNNNSLFSTEILLDIFLQIVVGICVAIINSDCLLLAWQLSG
jgi:hypothetical protein